MAQGPCRPSEAESISAWNRVARMREEVERLRVLGHKCEAIMDSIVGVQGFNWSEHAYPLRDALTKAGFPGKGYDIARKDVGTLIDNNARMREVLEALAEAPAGPTAAYTMLLHHQQRAREALGKT